MQPAQLCVAPAVRPTLGQGLDSYDLGTMARDVKALVLALGYERCMLLGHDWGGKHAWLVAAMFPDMVEALVTIACPHPVLFMAN